VKGARLAILCAAWIGMSRAASPCDVPADEYPDTYDLASPLVINQTYFGHIDVQMDRDLFTFVAMPYVSYRVRMTPLGLPDSEVRVFDPFSNLVSRATSTGTNTAAICLVTPGTSLRRVYVDARAFAEYLQGSYEMIVQLDPVVDIDQDNLPDAFENAYGLSTSSPGPDGVDGANWDSDGDGMSNYDEMLAGTHPKSASSVVKILQYINPNGQAVIEWPAIPGGTYRLEFSNAGILMPVWQTVLSSTYLGPANGVMQFALPPSAPGQNQAVYRVLFVVE
jgi:hypothetical protein